MPRTDDAHVIPRVGSQELVLVVNAHASGSRKALIDGVQSELRRWGARATTLVTESASEWMDALVDDPERRIVLVGGDGTVHAAANGSPRPTDIAIVPAGRANNIARSLGIPLAPGAAVKLAVEGDVRPIDLIEATTPTRTWATVEAVSVGFLAEARSYYHGDNSAHVARALAAGAHALATFHPRHVRITTRDWTTDLELTQLFVANLPLYGFGLHVAPAADPTDELLDLVGVDARSRMAIPSLIGRLRRESGWDGHGARHWLAERARIETLEPTPVVADSYDLGSGPLDVRVLPKRLRIVRP